MATNAEYAFWLSRPADKPELEFREVLPIDELGRGHRITRSLVRRQSHPDYLVRDQLLEVIEKPYFELLSFEPEPTESYPNLYRVEFNYEHEYHPPGGTFNWPQKGKLWLDADNCWVIVRCQVKNKLVTGDKDTSYTEQVFEFAPKDGNSDRPRTPVRRTEYYDLDENWNKTGPQQYVTEYELLPNEKFDQQTTRLTHYGFAEPVFDVTATNDVVEIQVNREQLTVAANDYPKVPFTIRNVSQSHVTLVRVTAC